MPGAGVDEQQQRPFLQAACPNNEQSASKEKQSLVLPGTLWDVRSEIYAKAGKHACCVAQLGQGRVAVCGCALAVDGAGGGLGHDVAVALLTQG